MLDYLIKNDLGHIVDNIERFPKLNYQWMSPEKISNAIICLSDKSKYNISNLYKSLTFLGCKYIEFRIDSFDVFLDKKDDLVNNLELTPFRNLDLYLLYNKKLNDFNWKKYLKKNSRIGRIIIHSVPENTKQVEFNSVFYVSEKLTNLSCGKIGKNNFTSNINLFMESQFHNSCLNKKVTIDENGDIKNCPSMHQNFGNIDDIELEKVIDSKDFKKYWNITKDEIEICKGCEYRYVCSDCRAFTEKPKNVYSKPLKCGYDPYTAKWEEWSENPLKQKAIEYYGMQHLVIKND